MEGEFLGTLFAHNAVLHYTAKNAAICNKSVDNKPISGCVRMACNSLLTTSLLQVVNSLDASCPRYPQACHKLFQQVATGLQRQVATSLILTGLLQLDKINKREEREEILSGKGWTLKLQNEPWLRYRPKKH